MERPETPLMDAIQRVLQDQDLQAITDPFTTERLLTDHAGGSDEVFYTAVQRAMLVVKMLKERGLEMPDEAERHVTGAMVGVWVEGFLTGAMTMSSREETS